MPCAGSTSANARAATVAPDLTREQALARFHVRDARGELISGGSAFRQPVERYARIQNRWTGCSDLPPFAWLLDRAYESVPPRVRPRLQAIVPRGSKARAGWLSRAGSSGTCVQITRGKPGPSRSIAASSRPPQHPEIRRFAAAHLQTERLHLERIEAILPDEDRRPPATSLARRRIPDRRSAGHARARTPSLPRSMRSSLSSITITREQIRKLDALDLHPELRSLLTRCRAG